MASGIVTLDQMVGEQVQKTPDAVAVIYEGEDGCIIRITYAEMWQRASQVCEALTRHGAERSTVGVCIDPELNLPSVLLGILRASSSYYPFGVDGAGFVQQALQRLNVTYLLLDGSSLQGLQSILTELQARMIPCESLQGMGVYLVQVNTAAENQGHVKDVQHLAYCITTSGTTGVPKIVRVPYSCIVPNIIDLKKEFEPDVGDTIFLTSPLTFDPSVIDIFITLTSGAALLLVPNVMKMSVDCLLKILSCRHSVSILQITPSLFRRLDPQTVKNTLLGADSALRVLAFGGESFPGSNVLNACLHPENGTSVYNVYGITELSCWATLVCARSPKGPVKDPVPIGTPLTGTRVKVIDEHNTELTSGTGHILIGGSDRTCLLNEEDEHVLEGKVWRNTGDIGMVGSDGRIYCQGRDDRQIKRHGKRLNLDTLEKVCLSQPGVLDTRAVFSNEKLLLFARVHGQRDEEKAKTRDSIRAHVLYTLPCQYHPDDVFLVEDFPVNKHGKMDIAFLLKQYNRNLKYNHVAAPSLKSWLCILWQEITGCKDKQISRADNFLACGGDSLKALQLIEHVEQHFGRESPDLLDTILTRTFGDCLSLLEQQHTEQQTDPESKTVLLARTECSREYTDYGAPVKYDKPSQCFLNDILVKKENVDTVQGRNNIICESKTSPSVDKTENLLCRKRTEHEDTFEPPLKIRKLASSISQQTVSCTSIEKNSSLDHCWDFCYSGNKEDSSAHQTIKSYETSVQLTTVCTKQQLENMLNEDFYITDGDVYTDSIGRANSFMLSAGFERTHHERVDDCEGDFRNGRLDWQLERKEELRDRLQLEVQWKVDTGKCVDASPLVGRTRCGKTTVFIGSHSHKFFAISLHCGTVVWSVELGDRVEGSACLSPCGRWVVVGCYDHKIYLLRADTGNVDWQVITGDVVKCSPVSDLSSQCVFCGSHDGFLYAFQCREKKVIWKSWMGGGGVFASPVISSKRSVVLAVTLGGHVTATNVFTGTVLWSISVGKPVFSTPAVCADHLYVGCVDSCLYCLSWKAGEQLWVFKTEAPIFSSPVVMPAIHSTKSCILVGSHDKHIYCLSETGELVWKHLTTSSVYAAPFVFHVPDVSTNSQTLDQNTMKKGLNDFSSRITTKKTKNNCQAQRFPMIGLSHSKDFGRQYDSFGDKVAGKDESQRSEWKKSLTKNSLYSKKRLHGGENSKTDTDFTYRKGQLSKGCFCVETDKKEVVQLSEGCFCVETDKKEVVQLSKGCFCVETDKKEVGQLSEGCFCVETDKKEVVQLSKGCFCVETDKKEVGQLSEGCFCVETDKKEVDKTDTSHLLIKNEILATQTNIQNGNGFAKISEQYVACASTGGFVSILCCATGKQICNEHLPGEVFSSPVVIGDSLVVGCRNDNVYCYRMSNHSHS